MLYHRGIMLEMKLSYRKLQEKYGGNYVLTDERTGQVIIADKNLGRAFKIADKMGYSTPSVQYVDPKDVIAIYEVKFSLRD